MTEKTFNMQKFSHAVYIRSDIEKVYELISTSSGIVKWFIGNAKYYYRDSHIRLGDDPAQKGDSYLWKWMNKDLELKGIITESVKNNIFEFTFSPLYTVRIQFIQTEINLTKVILSQEYQESALRNDFNYINCCVCWVFFLTNLKSVIENGIDLREKEFSDEMMVNF